MKQTPKHIEPKPKTHTNSPKAEIEELIRQNLNKIRDLKVEEINSDYFHQAFRLPLMSKLDPLLERNIPNPSKRTKIKFDIIENRVQNFFEKRKNFTGMVSTDLKDLDWVIDKNKIDMNHIRKVNHGEITIKFKKSGKKIVGIGRWSDMRREERERVIGCLKGRL